MVNDQCKSLVAEGVVGGFLLLFLLARVLGRGRIGGRGFGYLFVFLFLFTRILGRGRVGGLSGYVVLGLFLLAGVLGRGRWGHFVGAVVLAFLLFFFLPVSSVKSKLPLLTGVAATLRLPVSPR